MSGNGATGDAAAVTAAVNGILKDEAPAAMDEVDPLVGGDLLNDDDMMLGDLDNLGCQPADDVLSWLLVHADAISATAELDSMGVPSLTSGLAMPTTSIMTPSNAANVPATGNGAVPSSSSITGRLLGGSFSPYPAMDPQLAAPGTAGAGMDPNLPMSVGPSSTAPVYPPMPQAQALPPNVGPAGTLGLPQGGGMPLTATNLYYQQQQQQQQQQRGPPYQAPLAFQPHAPLGGAPPQQMGRGGGTMGPRSHSAGQLYSGDMSGGVMYKGGFVMDGGDPPGMGLARMPRTDSMESFYTVTSEGQSEDEIAAVSNAAAAAAASQGDKKKRRLQKNRESARECRRRQRAHAEELAGRVASLEAENRHLQNHLQSVQQRVKGLEKQKLSMEKELEDMLKRNCSDEEMASYVDHFKELYADYGEQRRKEVKFHLQQLESLLLPTQTTKMSLWTLEQGESFFKDTGKTSLSAILSGHLGISQEQKLKIQSRRERIKQLVDHLKKSLRLLNRLKDNVEGRHARFEDKMSGLQQLLTPRQRAKLVLWVTRNESFLAQVIPGFRNSTFGMELCAGDEASAAASAAATTPGPTSIPMTAAPTSATPAPTPTPVTVGTAPSPAVPASPLGGRHRQGSNGQLSSAASSAASSPRHGLAPLRTSSSSSIASLPNTPTAATTPQPLPPINPNGPIITTRAQAQARTAAAAAAASSSASSSPTNAASPQQHFFPSSATPQQQPPPEAPVAAPEASPAMEQVVVGAVPASGMDAALPMPVLPPVPMDVAEPQQQQAETAATVGVKRGRGGQQLKEESR